MHPTDKAYIKALEETLSELLRWMSSEIGWEYFRAEMLSAPGSNDETIHNQNAEMMKAKLREITEKHPKIKEALKW